MKKLLANQFLFINLIILLTSCSLVKPKRAPSSIHGSGSCISASRAFTDSESPFPHLLTMESNSIAAIHRDTLANIYKINSLMKLESDILAQNQNMTTHNFFMQLLDMKNAIADEFIEMSKQYDDPFFKSTLISASERIKASPEKRIKLTNKVSDYGQRAYRSADLYDLNHRYYSGEIASVYGEIGEVLIASLLDGVEKRGAYTYEMLAQIDSLRIPNAIKLQIAQGNGVSQKEEIKEALRQLIPVQRYDESLLASFINKEVDLIRANGTEWIEVKNYKRKITWDDMRSGGNYHKVAQQAEKTDLALKMLGIRDQITLKQTFVNCVDELAATKFQQLYGIEVIGCVE